MSKFDLLDPISRGPWSSHTAQAIEDNFSKIFSNSGRFGQDPSSVLSQIPVSTGVGNPQGVIAAAVGSQWVDTVTGYLYRKLGGGNTQYGWYYVPQLGAGAGGKLHWTLTQGAGFANGFSNGSGHGVFSSDTVVTVTGTGVTTPVRTIVNGKTYAQAQSGAVAGNSMGITTPTTGPFACLDDDIDLTFEIRTGADITNLRLWAGISSAGVSDTATLGSASNGSIAFRYSTVAGDGPDTGWIGTTQVNGAGNQSKTAQIAAIAASTNYKLRLRFVRQNTPAAYFSIDDGAETQLTTNIPNTGNTYFIVLMLSTQANVAKILLWRTLGATVGS